MTLREYGQSIAGWWEGYLTEITTKNVLDWSISHLILTGVAAFIGLGILAGVAELVFVPVLSGLSKAWEKTGLPAKIERMEARFGPFVSTLIAVGAIFILFAIAFVLIGLVENSKK